MSPLESGYLLDKVYCPSIHFDGLPATESMPDDDEVQVALGWDWRILEPTCFEVILVLGISPCQQRPEKAEVVTVGRFRLKGEAQSLELHRFVKVGAPSILFAYARETLAAVTGKGLRGAFLLSPLNVVEALKGFDEDSTTAARQIRETPSLAALKPLNPRTLAPAGPLDSEA